MTDASAHPDDPHYITRSGWPRAAVLGANDGIVSVSSLIVGIAAATLNVAPVKRATLRVVVWGVFAMAVTAAVGWLFGLTLG